MSAAAASVWDVAAQHADDLAHVNDDAARVMLPILPMIMDGVQSVPCFQADDSGGGGDRRGRNCSRTEIHA